MTISVILGTRPEAIKLAPVILELKKRGKVKVEVCSTGQHRRMLDESLSVFGISPDTDLDLMQPGQSLADFSARAIKALDGYLSSVKPGAVLVQGDTTTVLCGALAAFYHKARIGHVEAGLRTGRKYSPFPEEKNRELTSRLADWHFAPTETARQSLLAEGIDPAAVYVTGNTVIDALYLVRDRVRSRKLESFPELESLAPRLKVAGSRLILVTGHRRESFGEGFEQICQGIKRIAQRFPGDQIVYPVHLNPQVKEPVKRVLSGMDNVHLFEPVSYLSFVKLMDISYLILTDSGGIQEEAPALGKPVLVMREITERPEAVEAGVVQLVGASAGRIFEASERLLTNEKEYNRMSRGISPYGDGKAAQRIVDIMLAG